MRYYKIYDHVTPEGQLYRLTEEGLLEVHGFANAWVESAYTQIFGPVGALMFFNLNETDPNTRIVEVEAPI